MTRWIVALSIVVTLAFGLEPLLAVGLLFVVIVPFERWFPRHRQPLRRPAVGTDVAFALLSAPLGAVGVFVGALAAVASLVWIPALLVRPVVELIPPLPRSIIGVLLFDVLVYWAHRFGHEVPFLWRFHRVHHSTRHLDWVSGFRGHPLDGFVIAPAAGVLIVAGFSAELSGALFVVQLLTGLFLHANVRWRWRPLHRIVITPEFHHWHHADEPDAHCTNYSTFLPVWDLLFGTYFMPADRRPSVYGVQGPVARGVLGHLWEPFVGLPRPGVWLRHPRTGARLARAALCRGRAQVLASMRRPQPRPEQHPVPVG
jgi:sterol desaturase/sphingolipid hydroxylase (fatty acid hydroxylase superfamily)